MKVLSGNVINKTLTGGDMDPFIEVLPDGDAKTSGLLKQLCNQEDKPMQPIEKNGNKWCLGMKQRKGSGPNTKVTKSDKQTRTQLFGQPLYKICPDDCSLPKPIAEMLTLVWKKGPTTEGVFRKPCNSKNMRAIREQLNSGLQVDLKDLPVTLLVGLLKSFLKELPGSLLVTDLYDSWMKALDTEDTQQRASEVKKVVDELAAPNRLLLQHLMSVLHQILESADINKMDANNLAVCIAPTLLQLDSTPLDKQHDKLKKVTKLTQFLIEHCEILGENTRNLLDTDEDNSDSLCSQQHDSAYDSTDPDADPGECPDTTHGEHGSSSSLLYPNTANTSQLSDSIFSRCKKAEFNRRCSEPILFPSVNITSLQGLTRSHDDCSLEKRDFEEHPLKKQISDDSFLLRGREGSRPVLPFPKLSRSSNVEAVPFATGSYCVKDCSCSSLESAASNQSEGSVFTSSPVGSPSCPRKTNPISQPLKVAKEQQDVAKTSLVEKKRSKSMRIGGKVLTRTRSLGAWGSLKKKDPQKEPSHPCETLQEDFQSEVEIQTDVLIRPRPLSAIEVFKHVDSRLPSRPPSYGVALQSAALCPRYGSMTVQDAKTLERRSRPSSVNYDFPSVCPIDSFIDSDKGSVVEHRHPFRQRALSESVSRAHHDALSRRCSQPVFEEFSHAKESYI
ncbi:T cell activation RhoGTPase activating protein b [Genypterus blacodes]|uniref:T cell activation RhoGTPase activating protein b n=1 Tax=Genypterus blacodes TaxID=154954 RepID=UPI003F761C54